MNFLRQYFGSPAPNRDFALGVGSNFYFSLDYYMTQQIEDALAASTGISSSIWIYGMSSLVLGIFFPVLSTMITLFGLSATEGSPRSLGDFLRRNTNHLAIETLRSWGRCSWEVYFF